MAKIIPITEHSQHFLAEIKESFWGDVYGQTKLASKHLFTYEQALHPASRKRSRLALSAFGACQPLTVEKIVAQHIEALGGQQKIAAIHSIVFRLRYREGDFVVPDGYMAKMRPYYKTLGDPKNWLNALR
jgi:hypothetical protein